jgi:hypothetical protein
MSAQEVLNCAAISTVSSDVSSNHRFMVSETS